MGKMLDVQELNVHYGSIHAIRDISLTVNEGEIVSLIGANGAGKTTTLHTITGIKKATSGRIFLDGKDLMATEPHKIITMGMAHVPEGRHIFSQMTVAENLEMGAFWLKDKSHVNEEMEKVYAQFPRLKERYKQQMLAIGRAIMSKPKIMLMDEPSMGLSPLLVKEIFEIIKQLNQEGMTILLVEQNAKMALSIAHRAYVLETGKIVLQGKASDMLENDNVRKAYLGA